MSKKLLTLYLTSLLSFYAFFYVIEQWKIKTIQVQKNILIKQAQTHFDDQINTRAWNAKYGGVYVVPLDGQKPNPYLKDNILKVDKDLTLIKINPAWMTRQLSEQSSTKDFHFKISSLFPLNPNNKASYFEKKALEYFKNKNKKIYYEFNENNKFNFMGALVTTKNCLSCHVDQGYKLGEIRGGISIELDTKEYELINESIKHKSLLSQIFLFLFLFTITILSRKQIKNNYHLENIVQKRTKEINSTKQLLQNILDNDEKFLLLTDGLKVIFANKTLLDFAGSNELSELDSADFKISDRFEKVDDPEFLQATMEGLYWIDYLKQGHSHKRLKILVKQNGEDYYFSVQTKDIHINNKLHQLITFEDITSSYNIAKSK